MIDLLSSRKYTWPLNVVIFNVCRLFPLRNNKIWVFGAREGYQFDENARYLFEYIISHDNGSVRCVWLTRSDDVIISMREKGYDVYKCNSLKGIFYSLRAGVAFYTNGLVDFGVLPLVGGAEIVSLWHGVGFKRIYNAKYKGWKYKVKCMMDRAFSWTYRTITIATSEYNSWQFAQSFLYGKNHMTFIAGQPRNDIYKQNLQKEKVLSKLSLDFNRRVIIYMPTYRGKDLGDKAMENIIRTLYESDRLNEVLEKGKCVFIAKLHPLTPHIDIPRRENFVILDYGEVDSNQELLGVSDVLITDYSSCCVDFALLNRPIIFYQPDEEDFMKKSEPLYEELLDILHTNRCTTPDELAESILNPTLEAVNKINDVFEDESIRGTCYSENVYKVICDEIGLQDK